MSGRSGGASVSSYVHSPSEYDLSFARREMLTGEHEVSFAERILALPSYESVLRGDDFIAWLRHG